MLVIIYKYFTLLVFVSNLNCNINNRYINSSLHKIFTSCILSICK